MQLRRTRGTDETAETAETTGPRDLAAAVASGDASAMLAQIDCCLAETVTDDEQAVAWAFDRLFEAYHEGRISGQEMRDQGDLLKAKYAHTEYIQAKRCCSCGCPWNM